MKQQTSRKHLCTLLAAAPAEVQWALFPRVTGGAQLCYWVPPYLAVQSTRPCTGCMLFENVFFPITLDKGSWGFVTLLLRPSCSGRSSWERRKGCLGSTWEATWSCMCWWSLPSLPSSGLFSEVLLLDGLFLDSTLRSAADDRSTTRDAKGQWVKLEDSFSATFFHISLTLYSPCFFVISRPWAFSLSVTNHILSQSPAVNHIAAVEL